MKKPKAGRAAAPIRDTTIRDTTTIYFATNRPRLSDGFAEDADLSPGAVQKLWLGQAVVAWIGDAIRTEAPRQLLRAPDIAGDDDFADPAGGTCAGVLDAWLEAAAGRGAVPLLFIHGFSNGFNDALQRAAQIQEFYADAGVELWRRWSSAGPPMAACWTPCCSRRMPG